MQILVSVYVSKKALDRWLPFACTISYQSTLHQIICLIYMRRVWAGVGAKANSLTSLICPSMPFRCSKLFHLVYRMQPYWQKPSTDSVSTCSADCLFTSAAWVVRFLVLLSGNSYTILYSPEITCTQCWMFTMTTGIQELIIKIN